MKTIEFKVTDSAGMHARPASILAKEATKFDSEIIIMVGEKKANLKSIMSILTMGILVDSDVKITIEGSDEEAAYIAIDEVIKAVNITAQ